MYDMWWDIHLYSVHKNEDIRMPGRGERVITITIISIRLLVIVNYC